MVARLSVQWGSNCSIVQGVGLRVRNLVSSSCITKSVIFLYPYFLIYKMGTVPSTLTTSQESNVVARIIQTDDQCENTLYYVFNISFEI